ncbi:MAG: TraR/DksA C4-type zinc finger protein [Patescibacteria group bacterium]|nr:TraR/DksA C4-type zinc finger protein [Patescibacteria group bacterium]
MENTLDKKVLNTIKTELLARREQIVDSLEDISQADEHEADNLGSKFPEYGDKPDENAQEISDYSTNSAAEKVLEKTLEDIDGALKRMEAGTYGICKYCGQAINPKRLQARPVASACIACKNELQNNE